MTLVYRPEIDGLRAIAVLAVVFYHAGFVIESNRVVPGGFLGVDIFFVISGYLITRIILHEIAAGQFSFQDFYERRARRILPALFTVMLASIPFAWLYMLPKAMEEYAGSLLSALAFSSNIWFLNEDSYIAEASELKPFLHTWSLAVEEQFYILFPGLLLLVWRFARNRLTSVFVATFFLSLALADYGSRYHPDAAFYLLPTRGWELLSGALLAKWELDRKLGSTSAYEAVIPFTGLSLIIGSLLLFDEQMRHPSLLTLVPVVGTMMLIGFSSRRGWMSAIMGSPPFVAVGLISYSLYLWHFPIFAFAKIQDSHPSFGDKIGQIGLSVALACLTYILVERPARNRTLITRPAIAGLIASFFVGLIAVQTFFYMSGGATFRLGVVADLFAEAEREYVTVDGEDCSLADIERPCEFPVAQDRGHSFILNVGDSHADILGPALRRKAGHNGWTYVHMTQSGCPLALDIYAVASGKLKGSCEPALQRRWLEKVLSYENAAVVYSGRFPLYLSGERFDNGLGGKEIGEHYFLTTEADAAPNPDGVMAQVQATISRLLDHGHTVILVYPVPEAGWDVPAYFKQALDRLDVNDRARSYSKMQVTTPLDRFKERSALTYQMFDAIGDHHNLIRIFPEELLCSEIDGKCSIHSTEHLLYSDDDHLSPYGASLLVEMIEDSIFRTFIH
jgi:peptidoglycan/LPS O-acetylase OafA/YrhL